ncbi:MAG TPA: hypothetical protein VKX17_07815 [Planctomycetota bacterium]|nr:hypothetical protein [Planctomycetota bacterium]
MMHALLRCCGAALLLLGALALSGCGCDECCYGCSTPCVAASSEPAPVPTAVEAPYAEIIDLTPPAVNTNARK